MASSWTLFTVERPKTLRRMLITWRISFVLALLLLASGSLVMAGLWSDRVDREIGYVMFLFGIWFVLKSAFKRRIASPGTAAGLERHSRVR